MINQFIKSLKYFIGIMHGSKAFIGPHYLQIMPTNECDIQCSYCVHYSKLKRKHKPKSWMKQKLTFNKIREVIDDAKCIGTKEIILTGGGEPLLYPRIYDVIAYIKKKSMICTLVTNGMHINNENVELLFKLKIDRILLNIFSGDTKKGITNAFKKKSEWLLHLKKLKEDKKSKLPSICLVGIISRMNYNMIDKVFNFGEKNKVDKIFLKATRVIEDTKGLLLSKRQRDLVCKRVLTIKKKTKIKNNINNFVRQIMHRSYLKGRTDREFPKKVPCYMGWISSEILANGDVIPCCASYKQVIGNINLRRFKDIWYSKEYNLFRKNSGGIIKNKLLKSACMPNINSEIFSNCVLYDYNIYVHKILRPFSYIKILKEESKEINKNV